MFDLGIQELIVIFAVAIIVFGPKKLPELSRNLGRGIGQLKKALFDVKYEINREVNLLDEEAGNAPEGGGEPKWKKEALDAIYGGKGPVSGGVQGPGPEHEDKPPEETNQEEGRPEDPSGGGTAG
ncbi:twin-arginine translocase TatA/TatE family subunit [Nitrospirota bacterium]